MDQPHLGEPALARRDEVVAGDVADVLREGGMQVDRVFDGDLEKVVVHQRTPTPPSAPLTRPSPTLSPLRGARALEAKVLRPACGEKVARSAGGGVLHGLRSPDIERLP